LTRSNGDYSPLPNLQLLPEGGVEERGGRDETHGMVMITMMMRMIMVVVMVVPVTLVALTPNDQGETATVKRCRIIITTTNVMVFF